MIEEDEQGRRKYIGLPPATLSMLTPEKVSLRQWYVGQAMQGLAYGVLLLEARTGNRGVSADIKNIVAEAFKLADEAIAFEENEKK